MMEHQDIRPDQVIGPLGEPLSLADLPPPSTKRWVVRRKAEVVAAVNGGLLSVDDVLDHLLPEDWRETDEEVQPAAAPTGAPAPTTTTS